MMRLQSALDSEVHIAVQRFIGDGVPSEVGSLYTALQKSNSSLKRKPKKILQSSIERVLDFIGATQESGLDSEAEAEKTQNQSSTAADIMNKSLRSNLAPSAPTTAPPSPGPMAEEPRKRRMANGEPISKRSKTEKPSLVTPTELSLDDVGGMDDVIRQLDELMILQLLEPESYREMNLRLPRGILLHGPPGCGKTMITRAYAAELGLPFVEILGPSIVSGMSGESEKGVRERFEEAKRNAPCLIFIDELDAIAPKRESSQSQMEKRIVAQLLVSMDELGRDYDRPVMVLAATNRPDSLDPALRRGGRFDTEIDIPVPNETVRADVLEAQTRGTPLAPDVDFRKLAKMTAGFVGADLQDLVAKAGSWAMNQYRDALHDQMLRLDAVDESMDVDGATHPGKRKPQKLYTRRLISRVKQKDLAKPAGFEKKMVSMEAFLAVLPGITPSSKREGFATIPDVSWEDIGALRSVREELEKAIVEPIQHPEVYAAMQMTAPTGVLLWGPPGCGKTLLAKAAAAECKANFIAIKGPELINKFVGESEAAVRRVFTRARSSVPCVIFFDELDALVPRRDEGGSEASNRVVNTLLTELDGLDERAGIYVIGATNRPDVIDDAMLRPGRLETPLFVNLPGPNERVEILTTLCRGKPIDDMAEIATIAHDDCKGYSGADLGALLREAGHCAIRRKSARVQSQDFRMATQHIRGSVGNMDRYERLKDKFGRK